jgi:hypothetical protein
VWVGGASYILGRGGGRGGKGLGIFPSCSTNFLSLPEVYSRISVNIRIIVPREHMYFMLVCIPHGKQTVDFLTGIVLKKNISVLRGKFQKKEFVNFDLRSAEITIKFY